jgi:hypothetical protein
MSATVFQYFSGNAYAGDITRKGVGEIVQEGFFSNGKAAKNFGLAVRLDGSKIAKFDNNLVTAFFGVLARQEFTVSSKTGDDAPNEESLQNVLTRGFVAVQVGDSGTPVRGKSVYLDLAGGTFKVAQSATAAGAGGGGNVGDGTITESPSIIGDVMSGVYGINFIGSFATESESVSNVYSQYLVRNPLGEFVGVGLVGSPFSGGGISFTISAGSTPFALTDTFGVTVTTSEAPLENVVWAVSGKDANGRSEIEIK